MIRTAFAVLCVAAALPWPSGAAASPGAEAAARGARYLAARQSAGGAFFAADAPAHAVAEVIVALVAGDGPREAIDRALGYVRERGPASATQGAYAARLVMGIVAAGEDPRSWGGFDYVAKLHSFYNAATGAYDTSSVYADALALLGVLAAGESVPQQAVTYLRANQCGDGGFGHETACLGGADIDTTAVAAMALRDERAFSFLASVRNRSGGFGHKPGEETNANSTGLALSAAAALDREPWPGTVEELVALQDASGGFRWKASERKANDYATVQAVPGAASKPIALRPPPRAASRPAAPRDDPSPRPATRADEAKPARTTPAPDVAPEAASVRHQAGVIVSAPVEHRGVRGGSRRSTNANAAITTAADPPIRQVCVGFDESEITGYELLSRAGLELGVQTSAQGTAVCRIGGTGCSGDCFCRYPTFWRYWTKDPGEPAWRFSALGAAARKVTGGSLDAWMWTSSDTPPPETSVAQVCSGGPAAAKPARRASSNAGGTAGGYALFGVLGVLLASGAAIVGAGRRRS